MGRAILSNLRCVDKTYNHRVKQFKTLFKKQGVVPHIYVGDPESLIREGILTETEIRKLYSYYASNDAFHEITIFTWG